MSVEGADDWALVLGLAAFVAVHLLALLAVGDPSLPALVGVEAVAVAALVAGDVLTTGRRAVLPVAVGVLAALGAVGVALGPLAAPSWVVAVGLLAVAGTLLYAGDRYDRYLAGGDPA